MSKEPTLRERALYLFSPRKGEEAYNRRIEKEKAQEEKDAPGTGRGGITSPRMSYGSHGASHTLNSLVGWIIEAGDAEDNIDLYSSTLRQRARDLYAGGGLARSGPQTLTTSVVGWGIQPKPKIDGDFLGMTDEAREEAERNILREFRLWAENNMCDAERQQNFYGLQHLAFLSMLMSGDVFALFGMKENKRTGQIPVIALTSSLQITEKEECMKQGADLCITFPFNMDYLHAALEKMLNKRESMAEYYKSPISTYVMNEGKIIHRDDKEFMNGIFRIIDENLSNPELSATMIAEKIGLSPRVMYRKLADITDKTLHQMIKESRMEMATKLLYSSKLTIDEIMYRVGYDNRSTFYRNFKEAKGMTPKEYRDGIKDNVLKTLT